MARATFTDEEKRLRQKEASKRYREANREKERQRVARYRAANPEKVQAYRDKNSAYYSAYAIEWAKSNPERRAEIARRHEQKPHRRMRSARLTVAQKAQRVKSSRKWQIANPGAVRASSSNRRALIKSFGRLTRGIVRKLMRLQRGLCPNCEVEITHDYHVDHIEPLARGGKNVDANVQLLCPTCNIKKGAKDPFDWAKLHGRLL